MQDTRDYVIVWIERLRLLDFLKENFKLRNPENSFFEISFPMKTSKYYSFKTNIAPRLHNLIENKINRYLTFLRTLRSASNNIITAIILRFTASRSYSFSLTI